MKYQTIVLFGASNNERRVSVASARNIIDDVPPGSAFWFWHLNGGIYIVDAEELRRLEDPFSNDLQPILPAKWPSIEAALSSVAGSLVVFFLALHGKETEDGVLQKLLESKEIAFTGSNSRASYLAFNKLEAKAIGQSKGLKTAVGLVLAANNTDKISVLREAFEKYGALVAKPVDEGSSVGVFFIHKETEILQVVEAIAAMKADYIIEQKIVGREMTIGVVERSDGSLQALPATEIIVEVGRMFDFDGKYRACGSKEVCPADLSAELMQQVQELAIKAHQMLGCRGYSRTDLILAQDGPYFLELNSLPGLTAMSLLPAQMKIFQLSMKEFIQEQIEIAVSGK